jgi:hypothetical protein
MIDRPPGPPLDGDTELRIGVDGMDGSGDANSDKAYGRTNLDAMPEEVGGALYNEQPERETLGACCVRLEKSPENLAQFIAGNADTAVAHRRAASTAGDEHAIAARRVADGALSAGSTLPRPGAGPSTRSPQRLPSGREVAAAWLLCVFIAVLALGATSGLHNGEPPAATVANKTAIRWHLRAVCTPPLPCAEGGTAILEPW